MKKTKFLTVPVCMLLALSALSFAGCGKKDEGNNGGPITTDAVFPSEFAVEDRLENTAAVHDPSIFQDPKDGLYYAFGSHFMVASSPDLIAWTQVVGDGSSEANGQREAQKLYGDGVNWRTVLTQSVAHSGTGMPSTWAPDVNYHDGKYYMYYSLTSAFGSNKSIIGRVSADSVTGPYANEQIIIASPGTNKTQPNCIDPELFEDKDGGLWMVYGSHFGGIYLFELENSGANWGLPKENSTINSQNDGFGKKLWNGARNGGTANSGANSVVEGPFVFYNASLDYYYLMTTYGDLTTDYNMHIARSKNPDGPYVDVTGADMATLTEAGTTGGNKIAGNYKFARQDGNGYAALGHNSVIEKDGAYFVVYHTRRQTSDGSVTAGHSLCSSQLYFNEEGWPVMSPTFYAGEKLGVLGESKVAAEYELIVHQATTTKAAAASVDYTLVADKTIESGGETVGSWTLKDGYYIELTIGETSYKGVACPGWDFYSRKNDQAAVVCITAVSDAGIPLWAMQKNN